jgi:hypothetical protein
MGLSASLETTAIHPDPSGIIPSEEQRREGLGHVSEASSSAFLDAIRGREECRSLAVAT